MPEGDTVWLTVRRLDEALAGQTLVRADLRVPQLATTDLANHRVLEVVARGKHLMTRLDSGLTLHSHLRMDGSWHLYGPGDRWRGGPLHQVRAVLETPDRVAVGYRLPVLELLPTAEEDSVVGHLGPDLLGPDWDPAEAVARLNAEPDRPIGEALLDQRNLAGVGNVYVSELCFLRGLTPWTLVGEADVEKAGRARQEAAGGQQEPSGTHHHRRSAARPHPLDLRQGAPAVPALRHPHPQGGAGAAGTGPRRLLVSPLPAGPAPAR
ncbi:formamidopyrimidine-DNA glycosylase [Streptomyces sp. SPB162]|nr:formamidopyrimidine-DNA glycosylase [Streptomyces sp. SPB162]